MRPLLSLLVLLAAAASASAQPMWRPLPGGASVSVDVFRPVLVQRQIATDDQGNIIGDGGPGPLHSAQILSARVPVGGAFSIIADLPTAYFSYTFTGVPGVDGLTEFGIGNPYLGVEARGAADVTVEAGVRLPLSAREDGYSRAEFTGIQSLFETVEAYQAKTFSAALGARFEPALSPAVRLRLRALPTVRTFPSFEQVGERVEEVRARVFDLQYGAQVVGLVGPVELAGGVTGRVDGPGGGDYNPTLLTFGVSAAGLPVRPGVLVRIPVRDYVFDTGAIVGFSLDVPIR